MNSENEIMERIVALEVQSEARDREIKELKEKQEFLITSYNGQALAMQDIKTDVRYMRDEFGSLKTFIEELKAQPKKELDKLAWAFIAPLVGAIVGFIASKIFKG